MGLIWTVFSPAIEHQDAIWHVAVIKSSDNASANQNLVVNT